MVCCVVVAVFFALPFILMRGLHGLVSGGACSMAWRPQALASAVERPVGASIQPVVDSARQFTIADRVSSFGHAGRGAVRLLRFEHSAWIQLSIAAAAVLLAVALQISLADWRWIVIACGLVLSLEGLNTAVERTCDRVSIAYCGQIKVAKDVAAGAVLLGSIAAALIGFLTFLPYVAAFDLANGRLLALDSALSLSTQDDTVMARFDAFHCVISSQSGEEGLVKTTANTGGGV